MAYVDMPFTSLSESEKDQLIWEFQETAVGENVAGTSIIIPAGVLAVGVTVVAGAAGTYKVQATTDKIYTIKNTPNSVTWVDWDKGTIGATAQDVLSPGASAVRLYSVTGANAHTIKVSAK